MAAVGNAADGKRQIVHRVDLRIAQPGQRDAAADRAGAGFDVVQGAAHRHQIGRNILAPFDLEHRVRLGQAAHPHHAQRPVARTFNCRAIAIDVCLARRRFAPLAQLHDDRFIGPDGLRARHVGQAGRQVDGVAVDVIGHLHHAAPGHADLEAHAQRLRPLFQPFRMVQLHEHGGLHGVGAMRKLRQYAVAQKLDGAPAMRFAHPADPLRHLGDHVGHLRIAQCGIGSGAACEVDEDHGD